MRGILTTALATALGCAFATTVQAGTCIVADPTSTPLNVRTAPNGSIIGTLDNGQSVYIIDHTLDRQSRAWVYVGDSETDKPLGWVFREFIVCKGEVPR